MVNQFSGLVFLTSLVLLLSFKDLLFINKDVETTSTPKQARGHNQPAGPGDETGSYEDEHDAYSKQANSGGFDDEDSDANDFGSSRPDASQSAASETEFVKKIPSLKMKSNVQTIKFSFW